MAMSFADLRARMARHRTQSEAVGVAALAVVAAIIVGSAAAKQRGALSAQLIRLRDAAREVASFQSAFRQSPANAAPLRLPDTLATSVDRAARVSLAQQIASAAERLGLNEVRVRFSPSDSTVAPPVPQVTANAPTVADYLLSVDCAGRFGQVMSLVEHLPPAVALQRLSASTDKHGITTYHVTLAVIESPKAAQHG